MRNDAGGALVHRDGRRWPVNKTLNIAGKTRPNGNKYPAKTAPDSRACRSRTAAGGPLTAENPMFHCWHGALQKAWSKQLQHTGGTERMETTLIVALSRQGALRRQMDVVANNLANMNTNAFKAERDDVHRPCRRERRAGFGEPIAFVRDVATVRDHTQGRTEATGNPLDVAIQGDGFFADRGSRRRRTLQPQRPLPASMTPAGW